MDAWVVVAVVLAVAAGAVSITGTVRHGVRDLRRRDAYKKVAIVLLLLAVGALLLSRTA